MEHIQDGVNTLREAMQKDALLKRGKLTLAPAVVTLYRAGRDSFVRALASDDCDEGVRAELQPKIVDIERRLSELQPQLALRQVRARARGVEQRDPAAAASLAAAAEAARPPRYGSSIRAHSAGRHFTTVRFRAATRIQAHFRGLRCRQHDTPASADVHRPSSDGAGAGYSGATAPVASRLPSAFDVRPPTSADATPAQTVGES
eukprot:SAG11_NODE_6626_length_1277_cov_1.610357_1_plen_203_part_01